MSNAGKPMLRPATEEDREPLFAMHVQLFRAEIETIWGWDDGWQRENFAKEWAEVETTVIGGSKGQRLGYLQVAWREDPAEGYVLNLAVLPEHQAGGIGTRVMEELQQRAREARVPLRLSVLRTNPRAQAFYHRLGFRIEETTDRGVRMKWSSGNPEHP
jgi:ribosomal protein S18 acetylase RimI-like enzyme